MLFLTQFDAPPSSKQSLQHTPRVWLRRLIPCPRRHRARSFGRLIAANVFVSARNDRIYDAPSYRLGTCCRVCVKKHTLCYGSARQIALLLEFNSNSIEPRYCSINHHLSNSLTLFVNSPSLNSFWHTLHS